MGREQRSYKGMQASGERAQQQDRALEGMQTRWNKRVGINREAVW